MADEPGGPPASGLKAPRYAGRRWGFAWRRLRRGLERLRGLLEGWAPALETEPPSESPDWQRRRREMEARGLRVESALRELEKRQEGLGQDWERALAELERVQEGWKLLREEVGVRPEPLPEGTVYDLQTKTARLSALWERLLVQQAEAFQEHARLGRAWRWILSVSLPTLEAKAAGSPEAAFLPGLRRRLEDLDRRWRDSLADLKRAASEEALSELRAALEQARRRSEDLAAELEALRERGAAAGPGAPEGLARTLATLETALADSRKEARSLRDLAAAGQQELGELRTEVSASRKALEEAKLDWERHKAASQAEKGLLAARAQELEARLSEALKELVAAEQDRAFIKASTESYFTYLWERLRNAETSLEELKRRPPPQPAPAAEAPPAAGVLPPAGTGAAIGPAPVPTPLEAPSGEAPAIPSTEPVLEPGWTKVVAALRNPIASAYAQLRRLSAGAMPEGYRAVLKLAAGAIAQASDVLKIVEDFLEEGGPPPSQGRLEQALGAALAAWEPALKLRGIAVSRQLANELPLAVFSLQALRLAFYQVIRNAYEAMPKGGTLTVRAWKDETGHACVSFQDTGPGFSPQALEAAFQPFISSRPGHLGLGLALARRVMRRARGEAAAQNAGPKGGAVVTFRFAAALDEAPPMS